ncbi:transposase (plasmid) [Bradyrhizobium barranii subsp. barranii]|nr:transposase [Bradyrhizobium barranii subsp. barranii]
MDSLAMLVSEGFGANPYDGGLYVFRSKRRDRVKILTWDGNTTKESRGSSPGRRSRKASCRYLMLNSQTGSVCRCELWISQRELVDPHQE